MLATDLRNDLWDAYDKERFNRFTMKNLSIDADMHKLMEQAFDAGYSEGYDVGYASAQYEYQPNEEYLK